MNSAHDTLPAVTIVVEWENAMDVEDRWARSAMSAFEAELERCSGRFVEPPRVMYLYDETAVDKAAILSVIDEVAPKMREVARLDLVPTPGLTYYKLKNHGASLARTEIVVMLDSDAGPRPGWLDGLLAPFADPEIVAVGGFTTLGWEDLLSKTMALSWIFNLPSEGGKTGRRRKIHANNCAFRTEFFRANPFPETEGAFKKSCGFWLRDIDRRGFKWTRTPDAMTVHAPHPGGRFLAWRAWTTGTDRDLQVNHTVTTSRLGRIGYAFYFWLKKLARSWKRIWTKGREVELPVWQRPVAMVYALAFFTTMLAGQLYSAGVRRFGPAPRVGAGEPARAA